MSDAERPPLAEIPASPPDPPAPERPRGRRRLLLILAAALGGFVACATIALVVLVFSVPTLRSRLLFLNSVAGPPPEAPDKFADPPEGLVSIEDDFSGGGTRWDRSQTRLAGGAYELSLELDNFDSYGLYLGGDGISDFDMAVDATMIAGPPDAEFGIRFRQSAPDDHLLFSISPSGYFRLARVTDRTYTSLVPWTRDERIRTGVGATNRLRVVAEGESITGFVNGEQVLSFSDPEPAAGQLTLGLVTFETGGLSVRFDNVEGFAISTAPDGVTTARLELNEQFEDPALAQWSVGGATISRGAYELFVAGQVVSWQQPLPTGSSEVQNDYVVEVEATMVSGNLDGAGNGYGLMFGDGGEFDFFYLLILPEGGIMLVRNGPDGGIAIPAVRVDTVNTGLNATNTIRLEVRDQSLTLTINDQPVVIDGEELEPLIFPPDFNLDGMVGLVLQSADADGIEVRFDNFVLEEVIE